MIQTDEASIMGFRTFFLERQLINLPVNPMVSEDSLPSTIPIPSDDFLESLDTELSIISGGIVIIREVDNTDPGGISQPIIPTVTRTTKGEIITGRTRVDSPEDSPQDFESESQEILLALQVEQCSQENSSAEAENNSIEGLSCIVSQVQEVIHATEISIDEDGMVRIVQPVSE